MADDDAPARVNAPTVEDGLGERQGPDRLSQTDPYKGSSAQLEADTRRAEGPSLPPSPGRTDGVHDPGASRSTRKWPWILATLAVLFLGAAVFAWLTFSGETSETSAPPPPLIETARAEAAESLSIRQTGFVRPLAEVAIAAEISGRIEDVSPEFRRGNFVDEGETLVRLETRELEADVSRAEAAVGRAEAALAEARVEQDRQEQLEAQEFASEARLQQAVVAVASAEAELTAARADLVVSRTRLDDAVIVAPFDALVVTENADVGDIAAPGMSLGRLVASEAVEVELGLTPADLRILGDPSRAVDLPVTIRAATAATGPEGDRFLAEGVVTEAGSTVDPATRTVPLIVRIATPFAPRDGARALRVDELVELELPFDLANRDDVAVPVRAIKGGNVVWEVVPDRGEVDGPVEGAEAADENGSRFLLRRRDVTVIQRNETHAIIEAGPAPDALVMTSDLTGAADGLPVRIDRRQGKRGNEDDEGDRP